jgi:5-methylcytosine-specific restriction endonuclease McrA
MSYQKIFDIDWKHAVILYINGKVNSATTDEFLDIKTGNGIFKLPKHIVLKKFVYIPYKELSPSRKNVFKRDNNKCQYCENELNAENATIDHVIPRSRGGKHEWSNLVACCLRCNRKKGNRTPNEANMNLNCVPKPVRL